MRQERETISHIRNRKQPIGFSHMRPGHSNVLFDGLSSERVHYRRDPDNHSSRNGTPDELRRLEDRLLAQDVQLNVPQRFLDRRGLPDGVDYNELTGLPEAGETYTAEMIRKLTDAIRTGKKWALISTNTNDLKAGNNLSRGFGNMVIRQGAAHVLNSIDALRLPEDVEMYAARQTGAPDKTMVLLLNLTDEQTQELRHQMPEVRRKIDIAVPDEFTFSTSATLLTSEDAELQEGIDTARHSLDLERHPNAVAQNLYRALLRRADDELGIIKSEREKDRMPIDAISSEEFSDRIRVMLKEIIKNSSRVSEPLIATVLTIMQHISYTDLHNDAEIRERMMRELRSPEKPEYEFYPNELLRPEYYRKILNDNYRIYGPILPSFVVAPETERRDTAEPVNPYIERIEGQVDITIPPRFLDTRNHPEKTVIDKLTGLPVEEGTYRLEIVRAISEAIRTGQNLAMIYTDVDNLNKANKDHDPAFGDVAIRQSVSQLLRALNGLNLQQDVQIYATRQTGAADETVVWLVNLPDNQLSRLRHIMQEMESETTIADPNFTFSTSATLLTSKDRGLQEGIVTAQQQLQQPGDMAFGLYDALHILADEETKIRKFEKDMKRIPIGPIGEIEPTGESQPSAEELYSNKIKAILQNVLKNSRMSEPLTDTTFEIIKESLYTDILYESATANRLRLMHALNYRPGNPAHESYTDEELRIQYYERKLLVAFNTSSAHNN